jgi:hypothetical protein
VRKTLIPKNIGNMNRTELIGLAIEIDEENYKLRNQFDSLQRGLQDIIRRCSYKK